MTKKRWDLSFSLQFSFFTRFSLLERFLKSKLFFFTLSQTPTLSTETSDPETQLRILFLCARHARAHTCAWLALPSARPNRHRYREQERDRKRRRSPKKCRHATIIAVELIRPSKKISRGLDFRPSKVAAMFFWWQGLHFVVQLFFYSPNPLKLISAY